MKQRPDNNPMVLEAVQIQKEKRRENRKNKKPQSALSEEGFALLEGLEMRDAEPDAAYLELVKQIRGKKLKGGREQYSTQARLQAALVYLMTGSSKEVERVTGIDARQVRTWRAEAFWWPKALEYAISVQREYVDAAFSRVVHKALEGTVDRLDNGDSYVGRDGEVRKIPVKARDLMHIAATAKDKQNTLRGQPSSISESRKKQVSDKDSIDLLAQRLKGAIEGAPSKLIDGVVIKE